MVVGEKREKVSRRSSLCFSLFLLPSFKRKKKVGARNFYYRVPRVHCCVYVLVCLFSFADALQWGGHGKLGKEKKRREKKNLVPLPVGYIWCGANEPASPPTGLHPSSWMDVVVVECVRGDWKGNDSTSYCGIWVALTVRKGRRSSSRFKVSFSFLSTLLCALTSLYHIHLVVNSDNFFLWLWYKVALSFVFFLRSIFVALSQSPSPLRKRSGKRVRSNKTQEYWREWELNPVRQLNFLSSDNFNFLLFPSEWKWRRNGKGGAAFNSFLIGEGETYPTGFSFLFPLHSF